jgi:poly(3-hydroxybutyrate) depolymerase
VRFRPLLAALVLAAAPAAVAQELPAITNDPQVGEVLVCPPVARRSRVAVHRDSVERRLVAGSWKAPTAGDTESLPGGPAGTWEAIGAPDAKGWWQHRAFRGGYAYVPVTVPEAGVWILHARGHTSVTLSDGSLRTGDPYTNGWVRVPVLLREGVNDFLFRCSRGRLQVRFRRPPSALFFTEADRTLPTLQAGEAADHWGAIVLANATTSASGEGLVVRAQLGRTGPVTSHPVPSLLPLSVRKIAFTIQAPALRVGSQSHPLRVWLAKKDDAADAAPLTQAALRIKAVEGTAVQRRTFRSRIDGSVQYYAVRPQRLSADDETARRPGIVLSLHGAGVEAQGQANAYSSKSWAHVVAATNRRPFGFDWEDWGRIDAMEVLAHAKRTFAHDDRRVYLTGHSMGGHGTWSVGALFPDQFAAIGPSAGWISFATYGAGRSFEDIPDPVWRLVERAGTASNTPLFIRNYRQFGIYILHGGDDTNVPASQARQMIQHIKPFHEDYRYHEEPGKGHWWNKHPEPGADCLDWAPMYDFFSRRSRPAKCRPLHVEFHTPSPYISPQCHWVRIEQQQQPNKPSTVDLHAWPLTRVIEGTTANVARLALSTPGFDQRTPNAGCTVTLDGQALTTTPVDGVIRLTRTAEGDWRPAAILPRAQKGAHRYGPFKTAFDNHVCLVYGTKGTPAENRWALAKARYDAETWWYRGNGSVDIYADTAFDAEAHKDRNVVCYGNFDTNAALAWLVAGAPFRADGEGVTVGPRRLAGAPLALLACYPRTGSDTALVGIIGGTGIDGMRLTDRVPIFTSGVAIPDLMVFSNAVLTRGGAGVVAAGYFGNDWSVENGEFAFRD